MTVGSSRGARRLRGNAFGLFQVVERRELFAEVAVEGGGGDSLAGDAVDEVGSWVAAALAVDFGLEPVTQGLKLAAGEGGFEVAEFLCSLIEELGGEDVAEGIGGEVAEAAEGPVDVLEDAFAVGGGDDAEVLAHFFVPGGGGVGDGEVVG